MLPDLDGIADEATQEFSVLDKSGQDGSAFGDDGQVRLTARGQLAVDGRIVFDLAGRLQPGDYTILAALYLNGNTVSPEIRRIPYRAK